VISGDGSCVTFASTAFNLVAGDTNAHDDVFVHEWATGQTTRVSVSSAGVQGERHSGPANPLSYQSRGLHISADGGLVAFVSEATQLVIPPPQGISMPQVYLHDRGMGTTVLVGRDASGQDVWLADGPVAIIEPGPRVLMQARLAFSQGPRTILWEPNGTRTIPFSETWPVPATLSWVYAVNRDGSRMANRGFAPVMVHHHPSGPTLVGSLNDQGELPSPGGYWSGIPLNGIALSPDGRWLTWVSSAPNIVAQDTNGLPDVFLTDLGPWTSLGGAFGTALPPLTTNLGPPVLWGVGDLDPTRTSWLTVQRGPLSAPGLLSVSGGSAPITIGGATLLAWPPDILVPFVTSPSGTASFPYVWPGGIGVELFAQAGFPDPLSPGLVSVTNALRVVSTQ
jgi:hypothetical protein